MRLETPTTSYESLLQGKVRVPSWLIALLPKSTGPLGVRDVRHRLEAAGFADLEIDMAPDSDLPDSDWEAMLRIRVQDGDPVRSYRVGLGRSEDVSDLHASWGQVSEADLEKARESEWNLLLSTGFESGEPLTDFHRQVQLLQVLAPDMLLAMDYAACTPRTSAWMKSVAEAKTPPSPTTLFTVHCVQSQNGDAWLHTHGLLRCGTIEIEAMDVPDEHTGTVGHLLNSVSAMLIENELPPADEPFLAGQEIELVWLPWEDAIQRVKGGSLGRGEDRDESHSFPSGILLAPKKSLFGRRKYASPAVYSDVLDDNPLLYISHMETQRMTMLASERLSSFRDLFDRYGCDEEWAFLVKLGYRVDGADDDDAREHLWFQVKGIDGDEVDAVLLNEPYSIERMHEGQEGKHPLSLLTDWCIYCEHGRVTPDTVGNFLGLLESDN